MVRFVCDVCGATADRELPPTWATVQATIPPPATPPPVQREGEAPFPPLPVQAPTIRTDHVCDKHIGGEATVSMRRREGEAS